MRLTHERASGNTKKQKWIWHCSSCFADGGGGGEDREGEQGGKSKGVRCSVENTRRSEGWRVVSSTVGELEYGGGLQLREKKGGEKVCKRKGGF